MEFTENGWPGLPATEDMLNWVTVPGTNPTVKLQIQKGQPTQILKAFVADMNAYIEPVYDADCACFTRENSVFTSNHRSASACDIRWESHPFHVKGTFGGKLPALRELLEFYETTVFWGGDWTDPIDEMHFQMGYHTYQNDHTADFIKRKIRADGFSTYKRGPMTAPTDTAVLAAAVTPTTEKVLPFDHAIIPQEVGWDCCCAAAQVVLNAKGIIRSEQQLIADIGTTQEGTPTVEYALPILNKLLPDAHFKAVWHPHEPVTPAETEVLWKNVKSSIDAGYPCILNFQVPVSNFPKGTRGSASPEYRGQVVYHYIAVAGYADDGPGGRHFFIADSGFRPFSYWMSLEQASEAIVPHAYLYASVTPPAPIVAKAPAPVATPIPVPTPIPAPTAVVAAATTPAVQPATPTAPVTALDEFWSEWAAIELGDIDSIVQVLRTAAGKSGGGPGVIHRARAVLARIPRPALATALSTLEASDPGVLTALTGRVA